MQRCVPCPSPLVGSGSSSGRPPEPIEYAAPSAEADVTVHGFRSAFRDWCGEETDFPREVAEQALAHIVGNEVERAYRRGDALAKRRELMDAWEQFCCPRESRAA